MEFPKSFIRASEAYNTFEHHVPAPYLRRAFQADHEAKANVIITALGFYELYLNGERITKGRLAPYINNPDDLVYYDTYEVTLRAGENVLGVWLGNGFTNNPGGHIWDFDIAAFRAAPQMALCLTYTDKSGEAHCIESDETWRTESSPLLFDDYRFGEIYDGRLEIPGWNTIGFDDSAWKFAERAPQPRGEKRLCTAEPIDIVNELKPISVTKTEKGYLYDFGINTAGVCRLCVRGELDQRIELRHGEHLKDGLPDVENIWFKREHWARDLEYVHKDVYTCRGDGEEVYTPAFTYHGFRYVLVSGITEAQATEDLLTALEMHSLLEERGGFSCSDETANKLQQMTRQSDVTNFYYFPTDCPQREKNGWTADAALSSEHILLNLGAEKSYREWLRAIVKAQDNNGALPGIVPTSGWGFAWGNGPAWDSVLIELPYSCISTAAIWIPPNCAPRRSSNTCTTSQRVWTSTTCSPSALATGARRDAKRTNINRRSHSPIRCSQRTWRIKPRFCSISSICRSRWRLPARSLSVGKLLCASISSTRTLCSLLATARLRRPWPSTITSSSPQSARQRLSSLSTSLRSRSITSMSACSADVCCSMF